MYLIVGLGNPEREYSRTRHNMGFDVINELSKKYDIELNGTNFKSKYGIGNIGKNRVILCKPQTYMNLSGDAVIQIKKFYKIPIENIIVIYDDIDTAVGKIRIKKRGSAGGHNGMKSVIDRLNTQDFERIRIGIGKPPEDEELIEYVIRKVNCIEYKNLQKGIECGANAVYDILENGTNEAMNKYN